MTRRRVRVKRRRMGETGLSPPRISRRNDIDAGKLIKWFLTPYEKEAKELLEKEMARPENIVYQVENVESDSNLLLRHLERMYNRVGRIRNSKLFRKINRKKLREMSEVERAFWDLCEADYRGLEWALVIAGRSVKAVNNLKRAVKKAFSKAREEGEE